MMDGWDHGMNPAWWVLMSVLWVLLIALVVWAAVRLFPGRGERGGWAEDRPDEILDRRLARGEIDPETYDRLREKLSARGHGFRR